MKTTYKKAQPKIINYRSYKYFNNDSFRDELLQNEANGNNWVDGFKNFISSCHLEYTCHSEKNYVQEYQSPFMNQILSKANYAKI